MFFGQYEHTIDTKGRLTIPSLFREDLSDGIYLMKGFDGNLMAMPKDLFNQISDRVRKMSITDTDSRFLRRFIYSNAGWFEFDRAGRILLPSFLKQAANLTSEVVIVGVGPNFELWSPEAWIKQLAMMSDPETNSQRFNTLDLSTL